MSLKIKLEIHDHAVSADENGSMTILRMINKKEKKIMFMHANSTEFLLLSCAMNSANFYFCLKNCENRWASQYTFKFQWLWICFDRLFRETFRFWLLIIFSIWVVWWGRNVRIFEDKARASDALWDIIHFFAFF